MESFGRDPFRAWLRLQVLAAQGAGSGLSGSATYADRWLARVICSSIAYLQTPIFDHDLGKEASNPLRYTLHISR
jgi:hypothetical protein